MPGIVNEITVPILKEDIILKGTDLQGKMSYSIIHATIDICKV